MVVQYVLSREEVERLKQGFGSIKTVMTYISEMAPMFADDTEIIRKILFEFSQIIK